MILFAKINSAIVEIILGYYDKACVLLSDIIENSGDLQHGSMSQTRLNAIEDFIRILGQKSKLKKCKLLFLTDKVVEIEVEESNQIQYLKQCLKNVEDANDKFLIMMKIADHHFIHKNYFEAKNYYKKLFQNDNNNMKEKINYIKCELKIGKNKGAQEYLQENQDLLDAEGWLLL